MSPRRWVGVCPSLPFKDDNSVLKVLVLKCRVLTFSWVLTLPAQFLVIWGSCPVCHPSWVVSLVLLNLVGALWSSSGHATCIFLFWMHSSSWPLPRLGALGIPCYVFQWLSFLERGWVVLCYRHGLCGEDSGPSLALRFAGFTVPAQPTRDNRNGRLLYRVRVVRCSWSTWKVHRQRCKPFMLPQVVAWRRDRLSWSPSGSGCCCHGSAGSRSRNGLFCVPWARCACAVTPSLLCEELAVILLDGCGCGSRTHRYEATTSGLLPLGSLQPSPGSVWWWSGPWFNPGLLAWTYHCLRLGDWSLGLASSFVRLPSAAFPWDGTVGGSCMSPHFEMLSVLFPGNIGSHFFGISHFFFGNVWFFPFLSS